MWSSVPWLRWNSENLSRIWTWQISWLGISSTFPNLREFSPLKAARRYRASWTTTPNINKTRTRRVYHHVRLSTTKNNKRRERGSQAHWTLRKLWNILLLIMVPQWGFQQDFHHIAAFLHWKEARDWKRNLCQWPELKSAFIPSSRTVRHFLFVLKLLNKHSLFVCKWNDPLLLFFFFFLICTTFTWIIGSQALCCVRFYS